MLSEPAALGTGFAITRDLAGAIYGTPAQTGGSHSSVLSLAENAAVLQGVAEFGRVGVSAFGFTADHAAYGTAQMSGVGINASLATDAGRFTIGLSQSAESGALLGLVGNRAFDFGAGSSITAANFGYAHDLGSRLTLFGNLEIGVAHASAGTAGTLVRSVDPATFNGFSIGASLNGVFSTGDRLAFTVTQPTRISSGAATINLPVGRTIDGAILSEAVRAELTPSGRQIDLGLTYAFGLGENANLSIGGQYSLDAGHIDGATGFAFVVGYGRSF
jgi:hypothetical protein